MRAERNTRRVRSGLKAVAVTARHEPEREVERDLEREVETLMLLSRGMAHDVHNILSALLLTAQTLQREGGIRDDRPRDDQLREDLSAIQQCAKQAVNLLDRFVHVVNNEHEAPAELDLSALLRDLQPILKAVVDRRAKLEYALGVGLPRVSGDATHLRRVVLNLVLNAAEACAGLRARIVVRTGVAELDRVELARLHRGSEIPEGRYVFIEVDDDGPGMDTATQRRMFEIDFTTKPNGKGLGLAILRKLVTQHSGAVGVTSALGRGTQIRVYLPAL